jgi:metal-responsive CopG/Arc/MetJ family transcriptional regulator
MDKKVFFNTTLSKTLLKEFKILAIKLDKRQNQLLEEAIQDLLDKYKKKLRTTKNFRQFRLFL